MTDDHAELVKRLRDIGSSFDLAVAEAIEALVKERDEAVANMIGHVDTHSFAVFKKGHEAGIREAAAVADARYAAGEMGNPGFHILALLEKD